jgi:hypothetical protein
MAQMSPEQLGVLGAALEKRRRDDSVEKAVGREVRRAGLLYQDYLDIMQGLRDLSRRRKLEPWDAIKQLLQEKEEQ